MNVKQPTAPFSMVQPDSPEQASLEDAGWSVTDFIDGWAHMEPLSPAQPLTTEQQLTELRLKHTSAGVRIAALTKELRVARANYEKSSRERDEHRKEANKNANAAHSWSHVVDEVHRLDHRTEGPDDDIRMADSDVLQVVFTVLRHATKKPKPTDTPNMDLLSKVKAASEKAGAVWWRIDHTLNGCDWHITDGPSGTVRDGVEGLKAILNVLEEVIAEQARPGNAHGLSRGEVLTMLELHLTGTELRAARLDPDAEHVDITELLDRDGQSILDKGLIVVTSLSPLTIALTDAGRELAASL